MQNSREELKENLQELGHYLMHRSMAGYFQFARKHNLSYSQMFILGRLNKEGRASVSELSSMLDISNSAVSQLLDKLVQSGYIERREDREDRRKKYHYISGKGEKVLKLSIIARSSWMEDLVGKISEEEAAGLLPCLQKIVGRFSEMEPLEPHHRHHLHHQKKNFGEEE
ncbi:MarR family winged helix-turn-helix transcriptional regulator [Spirochaeta isovalerica]|uniref:DNA-binding MarR family transcriptional regulator n=1 Tax=Spirochaeta isovalerica TaxID=150 RepID=A0A841R8A2_9SPIO|nr:MarR family transcriptional regulator [Spirochaeta isovalerica]MBB6480046.1 DNA-binding MarR family transcriptional regulator [Spirochaeta isovalerica]